MAGNISIFKDLRDLLEEQVKQHKIFLPHLTLRSYAQLDKPEKDKPIDNYISLYVLWTNAKWNRKNLIDEIFSFLFDEECEDKIVVFDCETSGLKSKMDNIISIDAVKIKGNKILTKETIYIFVKQEEQISHESYHHSSNTSL